MTEGEKKADAATQAGFLCLGLTGVWGWKSKGEGRGEKGEESRPIRDLGRIQWDRREVILAFDSDAAHHPEVGKAEDALAAELSRRGAFVDILRIPPGPEGAKQGLDDLLAGRGPEALRALIEGAPYWGWDRLNLVTAEEMGNSPRKAVDWLVEGLLPGGSFDLLVASPKRGKSLFALNLAAAVASGTPFLHHPTTQAPVLYVSWEDDAPLLWERWNKIVRDLPAPVPDKAVQFATPSEPFTAVWEALEHVIRATRVKLVVIDPWVFACGLDDENDNAKVGEVTRKLQSLAKAEGVTILAVHHTRKSGGDGGNEVRGAGALFGAAMVLLSLRSEEVRTEGGSPGDGAAHVSVGELKVTSKYGPQAIPMGLRGDTLRWEALERAKRLEGEGLLAAVLACVEAEECDAPQIIERTGLSRTRVYDALERLLRERKVAYRKEGQGGKRIYRAVKGGGDGG